MSKATFLNVLNAALFTTMFTSSLSSSSLLLSVDQWKKMDTHRSTALLVVKELNRISLNCYILHYIGCFNFKLQSTLLIFTLSLTHIDSHAHTHAFDTLNINQAAVILLLRDALPFCSFVCLTCRDDV